MYISDVNATLCDWYVPHEIHNVFPTHEQWREKYSGLSKETKSGLSVCISLRACSLSLENWLQLKIALSNLIFLKLPAITNLRQTVFPLMSCFSHYLSAVLNLHQKVLHGTFHSLCGWEHYRLHCFLYEALTNPNW